MVCLKDGFFWDFELKAWIPLNLRSSNKYEKKKYLKRLTSHGFKQSK